MFMRIIYESTLFSWRTYPCEVTDAPGIAKTTLIPSLPACLHYKFIPQDVLNLGYRIGQCLSFGLLCQSLWLSSLEHTREPAMQRVKATSAYNHCLHTKKHVRRSRGHKHIVYTHKRQKYAHNTHVATTKTCRQI